MKDFKKILRVIDQGEQFSHGYSVYRTIVIVQIGLETRAITSMDVTPRIISR